MPGLERHTHDSAAEPLRLAGPSLRGRVISRAAAQHHHIGQETSDEFLWRTPFNRSYEVHSS